ncbi:MAG: hypothetical protein ACR2JE_17875 [Acidobacteriaceae bacterium]
MTAAAKNEAGKALVPRNALAKHAAKHAPKHPAKHVPTKKPPRTGPRDPKDPPSRHDLAVLVASSHGPGNGPAKKKAGKKGPGKKGPGKKGLGKDLRRAFEHLARVSVLTQGAKGDAALLALSGQLRDLAIGGVESAEHAPEHAKAAADLARAAEHAAFASVLGKVTEDSIEWTDDLERAWTRDFTALEDETALPNQKKARKKNHIHEDDEADSELRAMLATFTGAAAKARKDNNHAQAIECVRGASALVKAAVHLGYGQ